MDKNLTVYPISNGRQLNIFCNNHIQKVCIKDMNGTPLYDAKESGKEVCIDIQKLHRATYIIEVEFENAKKSRSIFVKT